MTHQKILEREERNYNKIYLYIEAENDQCRAYDFSAYLITNLFEAQKLELREEADLETIIYTLQLPLQLVVEQFDDNYTQVGEQFIKITIDNLSRCIQWKLEFEELKMVQQSSIKIKKPYLGFFRLG